MSTVRIGADIRYNLGINTIVDESGADVKNRVFRLGMFCQFK